jgi:hypothetical protein
MVNMKILPCVLQECLLPLKIFKKIYRFVKRNPDVVRKSLFCFQIQTFKSVITV